MTIAGVVLILAGLILLVLLPRLRPSKPPLRLGLTSKSQSDPESPREKAIGSESHHQAA